MNRYRKIRDSLALSGVLAALLIANGGPAQAAQEELRVQMQRPAQASAPAPVRHGAQSRSVTVGFADLDMRRAEGASTLYARLRTAAHTVCSPMVSRDLAERRDWRRCYSDALDQAVSAAGSGQLSTLHTARTGRKPSADVALRD